MSKMSSFAAASLGVVVPQDKPLIGEVISPITQVGFTFPFQSYFDDALLERAIAVQKPNELIVASTRQESQLSGYAIALHPSSQTPVAIEFKVAAQPTSSSAIILKPGELARPLGMANGQPGYFGGFSWGIPFGWLGGGVAKLSVLRSSDAAVDWTENAELIFHRTRMQIVAPGALPANARFNWPMRFPWPLARQGANSLIQAGQPLISIARPTRVFARLRLPTLAAPADMRILIQGSNDFDLAPGATPTSPDVVTATPVGYIDHTWGTFVGSGGAGNLATQYPIVELPPQLARLAADGAGITLVDLSGGSLTGAYVDIVRYGHL